MQSSILTDQLVVPPFGVDTLRYQEKVVGVDLLLQGQQPVVVRAPIGRLPVRLNQVGLFAICGRQHGGPSLSLNDETHLVQILAAVGRRRELTQRCVLVVDVLYQLLEGTCIASVPGGREWRERRDVRDGPPEGGRHRGLVVAHLGNCTAPDKAATSLSAMFVENAICQLTKEHQR